MLQTVFLEQLCVLPGDYCSHLFSDFRCLKPTSHKRPRKIAALLLKQTHSVHALYKIPSCHVSKDESLLEVSNLSPHCPVRKGSHYLSVTSESLAGLFKQMLMDVL